MLVPKIYDVSLPIYPGMLVWPGNPAVGIEAIKSIERGASSNVSLLRIGTHTATHVDAPRHFIPGAGGVDSIEPQVLLGKARLFHLADIERIDRELLKRLDLDGITRVLFATSNSALLRKQQHEPRYVYVSEGAARYLVDIGIKLVGVDYLSIEQYQNKSRPAHHILLGAGVVIVEGLDLSGVPPGDFELICLPLKLRGADGAPARVFLREL